MPSTVRTGVASGVSALSWMAFLPFALVFGVVSRDHGVRDAGWMLVAVTVLAGLLLIKVALVGRRRPARPVEVVALPEPSPALAA